MHEHAQGKGRSRQSRTFKQPVQACSIEPVALFLPALQVVGVSVDSQFSHLAFSNTPRNKGGLGGCAYPLLADITKKISADYGVLITEGGDAGVSLR
jgi:hypothetical protein